MESDVVGQLLQYKSRLLAHIQSKINDPDIAEDLLQDSLLKALRAAPELRDEQKLLSWFYSILNNAITDLYRRQAVETRSLQQMAQEYPLDDGPETERVLCACFRDLLPTLKPEYALLIEQLDLTDSKPAQIAAQLGITSNNLKVRRHRARQVLRQRLEESCRLCAKHGCLDCTCQENGTQIEVPQV